jgi:hypothetical protein
MRGSLKNFRLALGTALIVAGLVALRALLFALGVEGMAPTALVSSIIGGGVFVMGLVIAGTLSDYKDAERAPTDLAAGLHAILREAESMHQVWRLPDMRRLRDRLVEVVSALRRDIDAGKQQRSDDDVSLFLLYEFAVHARHADGQLASKEVVEIVERLEDQEAAGAGPAAADPDAGGGEALAELDDAVDTAVASVRSEPDPQHTEEGGRP